MRRCAAGTTPHIVFFYGSKEHNSPRCVIILIMIASQVTLFALDCGATNWRLYRAGYRHDGNQLILLSEPQPSPLTSFVERRLPSVLSLTADGNGIECLGEAAQQKLEDENQRESVREYFKPCIGAHLEAHPLPHQKRYTHQQALFFTKMMLEKVVEQIQQEKWLGAEFDDQVMFSFAHPVHWGTSYKGVILDEFKQIVYGCFPAGFQPQIHFMAEPDGAILALQQHGLFSTTQENKITLIADVGGSTTDIVAGQVNQEKGELEFIGRYGEPFGGGLFDAELAKYLAQELKIPTSAVMDDPSIMTSLRVAASHLKEALSRQCMQTGEAFQVPKRSITVVSREGEIYRRLVSLDEATFIRLAGHLMTDFENLIENALNTIGLKEIHIQQVVLVGGCAQLFTVVSTLRQRFSKERVLLADNPAEIVAQGIALVYGKSSENFKHVNNATISGQKNEDLIPASAVASIPAAKKSESGAFTEETKSFSSIKEELLSAWVLKTLSGAQSGAFVQLGYSTKLGRASDNDIILQDGHTSSKHAKIERKGDILTITDLNSTNGTFLNNKRIYQPTIIGSGDKILIGNSEFILERGLTDLISNLTDKPAEKKEIGARSEVICAQCGSQVKAGKKFCWNCGAAVQSVKEAPTNSLPIPLTCPKCKQVMQVGKIFCWNCGNILSQ